jgi:uncharacterized protein DUF3806
MEQIVTRPSPEDAERIESQRRWVREHFDESARHLYEQRDEKLRLLQAIIDAGWIEASETIKLQSLGVTLGDALVQELGLEWVMVEDEHGRDPAVRKPGTTVIAFPLTMISKRIERGDAVVVQELFEGVVDYVRRMASDPEYQRH